MNPTRPVRRSGCDSAPDHDHSSGQVDGVDIVASDLFCLYPLPGGGTVAALRGMALRVPAGERLVVHGPNGSGKTTLLRVLIGEVAPSAGSVSVAGTELAGASRARLTALRRDVLGLVDQHSGRALRAELSVLDNVALQLRLAGRRRAEARARAADVLGSLGLESLAGRRTSSLSAGEAQRVAVCAAVVHAPRIVLADEPTGELDVDSADAVYALLRRASEQAGTTLLLVTHDARAAAVGDRIVRIRDGRLSEQWRPGESAAGERLVVDARGWVRLPEGLRRAAGLGESVRAQSVESFGAPPGPSADGIVLAADPGSGPPVTPTPPAALPGPLRLLEAPGAVAELRDVHLAYPGRTVLDGRTIEIAPAVLTVLRGRSGAGKSTLLRLLLGLADPDRGQVRLGGVDLAGLDRAGRAKLRRDLLGVATQNGALAETLDARENLALARSAGGLDADVDADADPSAIDAVIDALNLTAVAGRQVRLLSGGERQRVAIARALAARRPLVVLDEPTSQQDEAHAELVTRVLVQLAGAGTAVLCATHDPVLGDAAAVRIELT